MDVKRIRRSANTVLVLMALVLGLTAIFLLGQSTQNSSEFGRLQGAILLANAASAVVLLLLIFGNLLRLAREYRHKESGARLKTRMVLAFIGLGVAPMVLVYLFASQFINRGIETWFDVEVERGLGDALQLSRSALDLNLQEELARTISIGEFLPPPNSPDLFPVLSELRAESGAIELAVFGENQKVFAYTSEDTDSVLPNFPDDEMLRQLRIEGSVVRLEPVADGGYQVRTLIALPAMRAGFRVHMLQGRFEVGEQLGPLADSVQQTFTRYSELSFLRAPLQQTMVLTLSIVVLVALLTAVYGAFFFSRRLVSPLESLVAGTRAVAEGDLDTRLPQTTRDEIGFLVDSFNDMIAHLRDARAEAHRSEQLVEAERANLEAILSGLSTGVIALNGDMTLRFANDAANRILESNFDGCAGQTLSAIGETETLVAQFAEKITEFVVDGNSVLREQITVKNDKGRRVLICSSANLRGGYADSDGIVLVFDDVTNLMQAQRDAAWGEVAKRLAHEIKNPLTPIQLSAERIRRKFLGEESGAKAQLLDRATQTIVQQVEAMRDMVNAFSEYARAPQVKISKVDINQLITQVADLYPNLPDQPRVSLDLDQNLAEIDADGLRLRQVLHNLVRNSIEALENTDDPQVEIVTHLIAGDHGEVAEILVGDNGPGFKEEDPESVFEPYMTTKTKGTGLGLAIVRKLIEEHGGDVSVSSYKDTQGACVRIRLPVSSNRTELIQEPPRRERAS